jgi:hypothetical protein
MLCIYCNEREADAREHYLPQCLGRFINFEPLLDRLCQSCNEEIGSALEREFCRRSPEAVIRSLHWIEGQHRGGKNKRPRQIYQPEKIGGKHLYLFAPDPDSGRTILWQMGPQPGTLKEVSQMVIRDGEDEDIKHIPIPTSITTGRQLVELMKSEDISFPVPKVMVIAASGDEERVQALFAEIGVTVPMQRRKVGRILQQVFMGELMPRMVKELDLFESNHGCGLNALSQGKTSETDVTQRYTVQNWCVTSSQGRSERVGPSPMVSACSSILTLRAAR